jgi:hypothetical protein
MGRPALSLGQFTFTSGLPFEPCCRDVIGQEFHLMAGEIRGRNPTPPRPPASVNRQPHPLEDQWSGAPGEF